MPQKSTRRVVFEAIAAATGQSVNEIKDGTFVHLRHFGSISSFVSQETGRQVELVATRSTTAGRLADRF